MTGYHRQRVGVGRCSRRSGLSELVEAVLDELSSGSVPFPGCLFHQRKAECDGVVDLSRQDTRLF